MELLVELETLMRSNSYRLDPFELELVSVVELVSELGLLVIVSVVGLVSELRLAAVVELVSELPAVLEPSSASPSFLLLLDCSI